MYSYITQELWTIVNSNFPVNDKHSISGHSMGGHGALICSLKNPGKFTSVSAFAPISNPTECPWGQKAFSGYLGQDKEQWKVNQMNLQIQILIISNMMPLCLLRTTKDPNCMFSSIKEQKTSFTRKSNYCLNTSKPKPTKAELKSN